MIAQSPHDDLRTDTLAGWAFAPDLHAAPLAEAALADPPGCARRGAACQPRRTVCDGGAGRRGVAPRGAPGQGLDIAARPPASARAATCRPAGLDAAGARARHPTRRGPCAAVALSLRAR